MKNLSIIFRLDDNVDASYQAVKDEFLKKETDFLKIIYFDDKYNEDLPLAVTENSNAILFIEISREEIESNWTKDQIIAYVKEKFTTQEPKTLVLCPDGYQFICARYI